MRLMAWLQHWRFAFINHQAVMLSPFAHPLRTVLSVAKELRVNSAKHLLFGLSQKQILRRCAPQNDYILSTANG